MAKHKSISFKPGALAFVGLPPAAFRNGEMVEMHVGSGEAVMSSY